jgi:hypothetical protein
MTEMDHPFGPRGPKPTRIPVFGPKSMSFSPKLRGYVILLPEGPQIEVTKPSAFVALDQTPIPVNFYSPTNLSASVTFLEVPFRGNSIRFPKQDDSIHVFLDGHPYAIKPHNARTQILDSMNRKIAEFESAWRDQDERKGIAGWINYDAPPDPFLLIALIGSFQRVWFRSTSD